MEEKILEKSDKMKIGPPRDCVTICFLSRSTRRAKSSVKPAASYYSYSRTRLLNVRV